MDRAQAYKLLMTEMQSVSNKTDSELDELVNDTINLEVSSESGIHYSISMKITRSSECAYAIEGNVHDNNSFKYELLEESIVVNK